MTPSELQLGRHRQRLLEFVECANMTMHRIYVDIVSGTITPVSSGIVHVDGKEFLRNADGSLHPVDSEKAWSGERYIMTGWHDDQAAAYAEVADLLGRRAQDVAALRLTCLAAAHVVDGGVA